MQKDKYFELMYNNIREIVSKPKLKFSVEMDEYEQHNFLNLLLDLAEDKEDYIFCTILQEKIKLLAI